LVFRNTNLEFPVYPDQVVNMADVLFQKINDDMKQSLKSRDALKTSTLRLLISSIKYAEMKKQEAEFHKSGAVADKTVLTLTDADIIGVIAKEIKQREESILAYKQGNRQDLVDKESAEMVILKTYMPQQMSREEIVVEAKQIISEVGAKGPGDKGKVMGKLVAKLKGKADGKDINDVVSDILSKM
jgi:uncharacterized protein